MTQQNGIGGRIIRGNKSNFQEYTRGIGEFYFEYAEKFGDRIYQIDAVTGHKETFASFKQRSVRLAINLEKIGITSNDFILICSSNTMDSFILHVAAHFLGAKTGGLHHSQSIREWTYCMDLVTPTCVFVEESCVENMEKSVECCSIKPRLIVFGKSDKHLTFKELQKSSEEEINFCPFPVKDNRTTAVILFSSGTTGSPKGMCMFHWSLINKVVATMATGSSSNPSIGLTYSTLYWISAVIHLLICMAIGGSRVIAPSVYNPIEMLEMIEKYKIQYMMLSPVIVRPLLSLDCYEQYDTSSLRSFSAIGSILHESEKKQIKKIFKNAVVQNPYGCSETLTAGTFFNPMTDRIFMDKPNSVGKCVTDCEIKVVEPGTLQLLGPNKTGEIYVKTRFPMSGYCNKESKDCYDKDGFFKTGDLGYYDEDECFYIVGRTKEYFLYRTYHIPIHYLESILLEHPEVQHAAVFGIPHKEVENHPAACVVLKENSCATVDDIQKFYSTQVSEQHQLRGGIKIVKNLPMTVTDKIQRHRLLECFLQKEDTIYNNN